MKWVVGRSDGGCYVEESEAMHGEVAFESEVEAIRYAVECEEDAIGPLRRNLRFLRARLKKVERA